MAFGLTADGFNRKRLTDIKSELEQKFRDEFGDEINVNPETVEGQLIGIFADRENDLWELNEGVYNSQYPGSSEGINLDNVASITGSVRKPAAFSVARGMLLFGTPGTIISLTEIISVLNNATAQFSPLAAVTLVAGLDEIQTLTLGSTPTSGSVDWTFNAITVSIAFDDDAAALQVKVDAAFGAGKITVAGDVDSGGPVTFTFIGDTITGFGKRDVALATLANNTLDDGGPVSAVMAETTKGIVQGQTDFQANTSGAVDAPSQTLTEIDTPVSGWDAVGNPLDAELGVVVEPDTEFALRRDEEVAQPGSTTIDAIVAGLLALDNVTAVVAFQNILSIPDLDDRPPHAVDIVVQGGDETVIAQQIFDDGAAAGIETIGDITKVLKDSQNFDQTIKFSRPAEVDIHVEVDLTVDPTIFPADGEAQVETLILAYGNALAVGQDVVVFGSTPNLSCSFQSVVGILDFAIRVGKIITPPNDNNVVLAPRELAKFDSSRVTVITL